MNEFDKARKKYLPKIIKFLFIAESPPSIDRFFYFEEITEHDNLFKSMMKTLYSEKELNLDKSKNIKSQLLRKFCDDGFFLLDAVEDVLPNNKKSTKRNYIKNGYCKLLNKLEKYEIKKIPIILISKYVYEILGSKLINDRYNVINEKMIPFPLYKGKYKFENFIEELLHKYGWENLHTELS